MYRLGGVALRYSRVALTKQTTRSNLPFKYLELQMAGILSRFMGTRRAVVHTLPNDENDVSMTNLRVKRDQEPDLIG